MLTREAELSSRRLSLRTEAPFEPFPKAAERAAWEGLSESVRGLWITAGEQHLQQDWPSLQATLYMDYVRTGIRDHYQNPCFMRRQTLLSLVMAECMEYKGRFLDDIVNGVWAICEESTWCWPAHLNNLDTHRLEELPDLDHPIIDLGAGETASLIAWTYYLLQEALERHSPNLAKRMLRELRVRILEPYDREDRFWWMSFDEHELINNWNPWCNSNVLAAILIAEQDKARKERLLEKLLRSLDRFIGSYQKDGGCDEGPAYWGHAAGALFNALQLLCAVSAHYQELYEDEKIRNMARYVMNMYIGDGQFISFADSSAKLTVKAEVIYQFAKALKDEELMSFGRQMYLRQGGYEHWNDENFLSNLQVILGETFQVGELWQNSSKEKTDKQESILLPMDVWMESVEVMVARDTKEGNGFCLAAKGGHNDESHNHNDLGSFIAYLNAEPVLIDAGVGVYTFKTFSAERYSIWTMQSAYHQTPTINGYMQAAGKNYRAQSVQYEADGVMSRLAMNLSGAYPEEAGVMSWERSVKLTRGVDGQEGCSEVLISDQVEFKKETQDIVLHWMSASAPVIEADQWVISTSKGSKVAMQYDAELWDVELEPITLTDKKLMGVWGSTIYRTNMRMKKAVLCGEWQFKLKCL